MFSVRLNEVLLFIWGRVRILIFVFLVFILVLVLFFKMVCSSGEIKIVRYIVGILVECG